MNILILIEPKGIDDYLAPSQRINPRVVQTRGRFLLLLMKILDANLKVMASVHEDDILVVTHIGKLVLSIGIE